MSEISKASEVSNAEILARLEALSAQVSGRQADPQAAATRLLESWLQVVQEKKNTLKSYQDALKRWQRFTGAESLVDGVVRLLECSHGESTQLLKQFQAHLRKKYAPATVNQATAVLGAMLHYGRSIGVTTLEPTVRRLKDELTRDTTGPDVEKIMEVLADLKRHGENERFHGAIALRDRAIIALLFFQALRINEALTLRVCDISKDCDKIFILAKGYTRRQPVNLAAESREALADWVKRRGPQTGYLFCACKGQIVPERAVDRHTVFTKIQKLGLKRCHGLRHTAAVVGLALTNGNLESVRVFMRHSSLLTTQRYLTTAQDTAAEIAKLIAAHATGNVVKPKEISPPKPPEPYVPLRPADPKAAVKKMVAALCDGVQAKTQQKYLECLNHFANWLKHDDYQSAIIFLLMANRGEARNVLREYVKQQLESGISASTADWRLSVLTKLFHCGRDLRLTDFAVDVERPR